jgi:hypothetical protein
MTYRNSFFYSASETKLLQSVDVVMNREEVQIKKADELQDVCGMMRLALNGARQATRACASAWLKDQCGVTVRAN